MTSSRSRLYVNLGQQRYYVERPFGSYDTGKSIVSDVACDSRNHIFVLVRADPLVDKPRNPVIELDRDGMFVQEFGASFVDDAHMLAIDANDQIYVVDRDAHQIVIFSPSGEKISEIGTRHRPGEPFSHPSAIAFGPDGRAYVADGYGANLVHRFSAHGIHEITFGERGRGPGEFSTPHGIWVLDDRRVIVADRENDRVQVFTEDGEWLQSWEGFPHAMDIWSDEEGNIYVVDKVPRLTRLDKAGKVTGCCRPVLSGAHGIYGGSDGRIFLAETQPSRLTVLVPEKGDGRIFKLE